MLKIAVIVIVVVLAAFVIVSYTEMMPLEVQPVYGTLSTESVYGILFDREMTSYPAKFEVVQGGSNVIGFSGDAGIINFGILPQGGVGNKFIFVDNTRQTKIRVSLLVKGLDAVKADNEVFTLNPGENMTVTMSANVTESMATGNYTGNIGIFVVIPRFDLLSVVFENNLPEVTGMFLGR